MARRTRATGDADNPVPSVVIQSALIGRIGVDFNDIWSVEPVQPGLAASAGHTQCVDRYYAASSRRPSDSTVAVSRTFNDLGGRRWEVWEVHPTAVERRSATAKAAELSPSGDRRRRSEPRVRIPPHLQQGWLAFESSRERRRLGPIPQGWASMSEPELSELLARAVVSGRTRRLIE